MARTSAEICHVVCIDYTNRIQYLSALQAPQRRYRYVVRDVRSDRRLRAFASSYDGSRLLLLYLAARGGVSQERTFTSSCEDNAERPETPTRDALTQAFGHGYSVPHVLALLCAVVLFLGDGCGGSATLTL